MPEPLPTLLTVPEVAGWLRVTQQTVRNWLTAGRLPHVRVGDRRVRIYERDFEAFLAAASGKRSDVTVDQSSARRFWDGDLLPAPVVPE